METEGPHVRTIPVHCAPAKAPCPHCGKLGRRKAIHHRRVRTLAYKINKNRKGHYAFLRSDAPSAAVQEMERLARLHDDVMRVMTVRVDKHEEGPSVQMQKREERGERGDRDRGDRGDRPRGDRDRGDRGDRGADRGDRGDRRERN